MFEWLRHGAGTVLEPLRASRLSRPRHERSRHHGGRNMSKNSFAGAAVAAAILCVGAGASIAAAQITIPTVTIGHPGNAPDPITGYGSVAYTYNIGTTEVTNAQYAAFLNAVAASDLFNLYNTDMAGSFGGITRTGTDGSYT